jgi:hypothetical protein
MDIWRFYIHLPGTMIDLNSSMSALPLKSIFWVVAFFSEMSMRC